MRNLLKIDELIAEGRGFWGSETREYTEALVKRMTDALEAATWASVHVDPEASREEIAREVYRELYPGTITTPEGERTRESDEVDRDRAYVTWDSGNEGVAPGRLCRRVADRVLAVTSPGSPDGSGVEAVLERLEEINMEGSAEPEGRKEFLETGAIWLPVD